MRKCKCGCGQEVTREGNRYLHGHNNKGKERILKSQLCECGCGELTKPGNRYLNGHYWRGKVGPNKGKKHPEHSKWMKENNPAKRPEVRKILSEQQLGKTASKKTKEKLRVAHLGKPLSSDHVAAKRYNLKKWQEKCPLLLKVEEMKEENGKIWAHCTNHNCPNSKEKGGWFMPDGIQLPARTDALNNGKDNHCFYCSDYCKRTCTKFHKSAEALIKQDEIRAGIQKVAPYTSEEYNTWKQEVLKRDNYICIYCGEPATHVHHTRPQKLEPFFTLDPDYGISCCQSCHYKYGHSTGTDCSTGKLANTVCKQMPFLEQGRN